MKAKKLFLLICLLSCYLLYVNSEDLHTKLIQLCPDLFFREDTFYYIGEIKNENDTYQFFQNLHEFGNHRMTWRLVVVHNDTIKGFYTNIQMIPKIINQALVFDFDEKTGSIIDFKNGIPNKVYLDGEFFIFSSLESISY